MWILAPTDALGDDWLCVNTALAQPRAEPLATGQGLRHLSDATLMLPAAWVAWHRVNLPPNSHRHLHTVVAHALEDQLLQDLSDVHLALPAQAQAQARQGQALWCAVIEAQRLNTLLAALAQRGLHPSRIVPELWPEAGSQRVHWLQGPETAQRVWVRDDGVWAEPLGGTGLPLATGPAPLTVLAEPALLADAQRWAQAHSLNTEPALQPVAERIARAGQSPWNFAQGRYRPRHPGLHALRASGRWLLQAPQTRSLRLALMALVAVQVIGATTVWWRDQQRTQALENTLAQAFASSLPNTPRLDAPVQMARAVRQAQQAQGVPHRADLHALLAAWAERLPQLPLTQFRYQADRLQIQGLSDAHTQQALDQAWAPLGLSLERSPQGLVLRAIDPEPPTSLPAQVDRVLALQAQLTALRERTPRAPAQTRMAWQALTADTPARWQFQANRGILTAQGIPSDQLAQWLAEWPALAGTSILEAEVSAQGPAGWRVQLVVHLPPA